MKEIYSILRSILLLLLCGVAFGCVASCSDELSEAEGNSSEENAQPFDWTRGTQQSTRYSFLRNYAVGYGYNAVDGEYCNWSDIRSQVINRAAMENLRNQGGPTLYGSITVNEVSQTQQYTYNKRDYVAGIHLNTDYSVDLGLYNKTKRTRQDVLEDGVQENFYYSVERTISMGQQWIIDTELLAHLTEGDYTTLVTASFRNAVAHMAKAVYDEHHDATYLTAMVDSFINVYGTHVVVSATLGGKVRVDLAREMWRYNDQVQEEAYSAEEILWAYSTREENRKEAIYKFIESSSINVTAYGGDQSVLTGFLGMTKYDGTRSFSSECLEDWQSTLNLDFLNEKNSNVELVDMGVRPIWDFVEALDEYGEVADLVKSVISQDVSHWQDLLGQSNFFSTSFPTSFDNPKVNIRCEDGGYKTIAWSDIEKDPTLLPEGAHPCVNIVSGGRYVAVVCQEEIDGELYWVAFPIYEGKANFLEGIAVSGDKAYRMTWSYGNNAYTKSALSSYAAPQTSTFYVNEGSISLQPDEAITYAESHPILYLESTGGVQPDGSFKLGNQFVPVKKNLSFILPLAPQEKQPDTLIGWQWDATTSQAERLSSYTYIYNPQEMDYVK